MNEPTFPKLAALQRVLSEYGKVTVALSGGLDSMTLAFVANRRLGADAGMVHAVSPSVPPEATARVKAYAAREGWVVDYVDAGEFADPEYLANPLNRCFFCKTNLYGTILKHNANNRVVISGANTDDLGDFRPGMDAAADHGVRHPFVDSDIGKSDIRAIARAFDLADLAELPASPCLSSRIETGIPVTAEALELVHAVETRLAHWLADRGVPPLSVRCRVRLTGLAVELDGRSLDAVRSDAGQTLRQEIDDLAGAGGYAGPVPIEAYRMGSAFLKGDPA